MSMREPDDVAGPQHASLLAIHLDPAGAFGDDVEYDQLRSAGMEKIGDLA